MSEREAKFWSASDANEQLIHDTIEDALMDWWDSLSDEEAKDLPKYVKVYGFAPMEPTFGRLDLVEIALESLDEEYGDPDGERSIPTPAMREAEAAFKAAILREYEPWQCELVKVATVDPRDYIE